MKVNLTLPWPPSVNQYYEPYSYLPKKSRYTKQRRKLGIKRTAEAKAYSEYVHLLTNRYKPLDGSVFLHCIANQPTKRGKHDLDNLLKALCDALEGNLYLDDSRIDRIIIERGNYQQNGELIVQVGNMQSKLLSL